MARTKKQTLVNACERRRQIQEEIRKETLAAKQKKENILISHKRGTHFGVDTKSPQNGVTASGSSHSNLQKLNREKLDNSRDFSGVSVTYTVGICLSASITSQANMSSLAQISDSSMLSEDSLPKAVIYIKDICRSPTKSVNEESLLDPRESPSSSGLGMWGKTSSESHCMKPRDDSLKKRCGSSKQSDKHSSPNVLESLRSLKAASEKVREEKRRKSRPETSPLKTPSPGRRSPRRHSPVSTDSHQSSPQKTHKDSRPTSDEKPKVNIFTDNLGLDLGKRIRSPRRLSEDMIALPIFSARRWSNSPKENSSGSKVGEEVQISDGLETLSLHANLSSESFKSPCVSPTSSKKSNNSGSSQKSPGSSRSNLSDERLACMGSKSNEGSISPYRHCGLKSNNSPCGEIFPLDSVGENSEHQQMKAENSLKPSGLHQSKNAETVISQEHKVSQSKKFMSNQTLDLDDDDGGCGSFIFTSTPNHTSIAENHTSSIECTTPTNHSASFKIKKDKSKEDVEKLMSSICRELMSDGVLVKCENRCVNNTSDSDNNVKTETTVDKDLEFQYNKETFYGSVNGNINSNTGFQINCDLEKESVNSKVSCIEAPVLGVPPDIIDEKPQSSLLCAMLVGGTEVAHTYTQERVRIKPQGVDTSDSELDMLKGTSPNAASRLSIPHPLTGSSDMKIQKENPVLRTVNSDTLDTEGFIESKKLDELAFTCHTIGSLDKKASSKTELYSTDAAAEIKIEQEDQTEENGRKVENKPHSVKKGQINLSNQLKKLNEGVLKLMEIDLEDEFLKDLEVDDTHDERNVEKAETLVNSKLNVNSLYSLISTLGSRLCGTANLIPDSSPVNVDLVESLIQSCPKRSPSVIPKLKTLTRLTRIHKRLEEENLTGTSQIVNSLDQRSDAYTDVDYQSPVITTRSIYLDSDQSPSQEKRYDGNNEDNENAEDQSIMHVDIDATSSRTDVQASTIGTVFLNSAAFSSSLSDSHCDHNLDAKISPETNIDKNVKNILQVEQTNTNSDNNLSNDLVANNKSDTIAKHSFQKSKTCDDFGESVVIPGSCPGTLRRVNSSPQFSTKPSSLPTSPSSLITHLTKDSYTKSKLGNKIPVPGTSYVTKSRKSWRIPRTIREPNPLSVLSELENKSSQPTNVFMCQNLQKYLNIPSNRIIVTPQRRDEMKILDARAQEEEEQMKKLMEENDRKNEEENLDYKNYEPDFDEVDGMLFMSFSSEVELRAHVRVEKALEWDKDDTMLKVSRAKAFEEAKAQNEDMGHFKLKHLRGQHMRWKKYRRLYSNEVKALLEAQSAGESLDKLTTLKKTLDISKIKGWKKKIVKVPVIKNNTDGNFSWSYDDQNIGLSDFKEDTKPSFDQTFADDDDLFFMNENLTVGDGDTPDVSTRSRRRQGFSHQKAHRQLFRELNMDWEDRMIHRKLGGWSLKGNRPQAFSSAAKKRQEKKSKEFDTVSIDTKDANAEAISFEESEVEIIELKVHNECQKKRTIKIIYPLLTEKMARNALKTLETGDIPRGMRKKKRSRQTSGQLPALTPVMFKSEPRDDRPSTPPIEAADICSSSSVSLLTSPAQCSFTSPISSSASVGTIPLEIDLQDEPVMEGVDVASESISSPSVTDTSSLKSCGKPGCRYGCICHLCSVSETSAPLPSPVTKQPTPVCDKEYCRLGCICDSLDPDKPITSKNHCRRPSCMLQCICPESGGFDSNEDIPYLPSMRRRPKPGERFSNLPQREKTHRSAKNLDAVTRKAMMLYETSEIYCERVERVRKRVSDGHQPDTSGSPTATSFDSTLQNSAISPVSHSSVTCSNVTFDIDIASEPSDDGSFQTDIFFSPEHPATTECTSVTFSYPVSTFSAGLQQYQPLPRSSMTRISKPTFVLDDIRQTVPMMEPSAHKRKRKSHPLSDEIFISSTCARTQPFKHLIQSKEQHIAATKEDAGHIIEISPPTSTGSKFPSVYAKPVSTTAAGSKFTGVDNEPMQILPKITSVHTLASENTNTSMQHWENVESGVTLSHPVVSSSGSVSNKLSNNVTVHQQTSQSSVNSGVCSGTLRQPHGWHKSMVCLKARAPPSSQDPEEEDVKEEDEVKLLEFTANCNWEGAKREILAKVAQCLTRGQYPQPRTMNVCEFVVEILPKAHQPSHIPPELRAKLPGQMYSIRVRITRRESVSSKRDDDTDVIDLSASPVKSAHGIDYGDLSVATNVKESTTTLSDHKPVATSSDSSFLTSSSFGISGLSKLFITSPPLSGQHNQTSTGGQCVNNVSKPVSRRSSTDSTAVISIADDHRQTTDHSAVPTQASPSPGIKIKGSSFMRLGSGSSLQTSIGSESSKTLVTTAGSSKLKLTSSSSKKSSSKSLKIMSPIQPIAAKTVSSGVTPIFGPFSAKDVKYMIPGKDGTMQLIEVGAPSDKNKKLIAVPISLSKAQMDLKCKQSAVVALPVSGMGQSQRVPLINSPALPSHLKTSPSQQIVLRLPASHPTPVVSSVRHPVVLQPLQSIRGQHPRFQVVPLQIGNCVTVSQAKIVNAMAGQGSKPTTLAPKVVNSCEEVALAPKVVNSSDEMIMVFDAAHIRASHKSNSSDLVQLSNSKPDKGYQTESADHSVSVNNSRNGPVISSEISSARLHFNRTIDLTAEKVPLENVKTVSADNSIATTGVDDYDGSPATNSQAINVDISEKILDAASVKDCNIKLHTNSAELFSKASVLSHINQYSLQTEISGNNSVLTLSDPTPVGGNFSESTIRKDTPSEIMTSKRNNSPSVFLTSHNCVTDSVSKIVHEPIMSGSKRHLSALSALEEPLSPCTKKACLIVDSPATMDEDSVASLNSMSGVQIAAASPLSNIDRPKSVMSGAFSTGSSDDLLVLLSSEEDVDVGEDDKPEEIISYKSRAERALENDHGSMYTKVDTVVSLLQKTKKVSPVDEGMKANGLRHEDRDLSKSMLKYSGKNIQKVHHHNQLERLRRSRMRVLFEELQQHVLRERGLPKDHVMSKVKVLVEAKKVVLHLSRCALEGDERIKKYEGKRKSLLNKLAILKANLLQQDVSSETICSMMEKASEQYLMQSTKTMMPIAPEEIKSEPHDSVATQLKAADLIHDSHEVVNLISPITEGEAMFNNPGVMCIKRETVYNDPDVSIKGETYNDSDVMNIKVETVYNEPDVMNIKGESVWDNPDGMTTERDGVFYNPGVTTPAYEDISEAEDFCGLKFEDISDTEQITLINDKLFNSQDTA